jgi:hypothetical protein
MEMAGSRIALALLLVTALAVGQAGAERFRATIGGHGRLWSEAAERWTALDDTTALGAVQPKELRPWENIIVGPQKQANIFGFAWYRGKTGMAAFGLELGLNPRIWSADNGKTPPEVFDGDPTTFTALIQLVPRREYGQYSTATSAGWETGIQILDNEVHTLDLGIEVPVNRIRFYPPQQGRDRRGVPNKNTAPQGFEVSVARYPQEFLLVASEGYPWHALDQVVQRTLNNSASIVDLTFPLQPVRFIRIDLSLMHQAYSLAEIEAYGEGFPPVTRFISKAVDFMEPVNFGEITYAFHKFRRDASGELREDPQAPVRLVLETKTGLDDASLAYHVVDELGRDVEVTQKEYERADPPRIERSGLRLPGMRGPVAEDLETWSPWTSPYSRSGEQNRSADGRRYLQFRFNLESDDVLAWGRLDSLSFEYSPLLVEQVVGEVSLAQDPTVRVLEVPAGVEQVFACDIRASFGSPPQSGFNGVRLDVPSGGRFLGLEMGIPLVQVEPDSFREQQGHILVYFPSHRVNADHDRPVRILLETALLNSSTFFTGDVFDTESDNLPQSINPGDANPDVATDALQVYASQPRMGVLTGFAVEPLVLTPNGDGVNDRARIGFKVLQIEHGQVGIEVLALDGRRISSLSTVSQGQGSYEVFWDGTDEGGGMAAAGIYLCRVTVDTESGAAEAIKPICVAY